MVILRDPDLSGDPGTDSQRLRRGDVIAALPDGHPWTPAERSRPDWLVVAVPGVSVEEGEALAAGEPDARDGRRYHWKRLFHLDLPDSDPRFAFPRAAGAVTLSPAEARAMKRRKAPHPDPDVIG